MKALTFQDCEKCGYKIEKCKCKNFNSLQEFKEEKLKEFDEKFPEHNTGLSGGVVKSEDGITLTVPYFSPNYKSFLSSSLDSQVDLILENLPKEQGLFVKEELPRTYIEGFNAARKEIINYLEK